MGLIIALLVVLGLLEPLAVIWAFNTLWGMGIEFSWTNWLAMLVLSFVILGPNRMKK